MSFLPSEVVKKRAFMISCLPEQLRNFCIDLHVQWVTLLYHWCGSRLQVQTLDYAEVARFAVLQHTNKHILGKIARWVIYYIICLRNRYISVSKESPLLILRSFGGRPYIMWVGKLHKSLLKSQQSMRGGRGRGGTEIVGWEIPRLPSSLWKYCVRKTAKYCTTSNIKLHSWFYKQHWWERRIFRVFFFLHFYSDLAVYTFASDVARNCATTVDTVNARFKTHAPIVKTIHLNPRCT